MRVLCACACVCVPVSGGEGRACVRVLCECACVCAPVGGGDREGGQGEALTEATGVRDANGPSGETGTQASHPREAGSPPALRRGQSCASGAATVTTDERAEAPGGPARGGRGAQRGGWGKALTAERTG